MWWWEGRLVLDGGNGGRLVRESGRARGRGNMGVLLGCVHAMHTM